MTVACLLKRVLIRFRILICYSVVNGVGDYLLVLLIDDGGRHLVGLVRVISEGSFTASDFRCLLLHSSVHAVYRRSRRVECTRE